MHCRVSSYTLDRVYRFTMGDRYMHVAVAGYHCTCGKQSYLLCQCQWMDAVRGPHMCVYPFRLMNTGNSTCLS